MSSLFLGKVRRNRIGLSLSLVILTLALGMIAGLWLPIQWHMPLYASVVLLTVLAAMRILFLRNELARTRERERHKHDNELLKNVLARTESISAEMEKLDSRARNDELRLRQIGQLAKAAAEASDEIKRVISAGSNNQRADDVYNKDAGKRVPEASRVVNRSTDKALGRLAAAVASDPGRAEKLELALSYRTAGESRCAPKAAVVGTERLVRLLEKAEVSVKSLQPSSGHAILSSHTPEMLIIEERAFARGAWFGANSSFGTQLMEELRAMCGQAKRMGSAIYLISDGTRPDIYSAEIRNMVDYAFPSTDFNDHWAIGADLGTLGKLETYAREDWKL